jgi:hypothetical protein
VKWWVIYIRGEIREKVMFRKKLLFIAALLASFAGSKAAQDTSGEDRVKLIMLNDETGMRKSRYVNPDPAELFNVLDDLYYRDIIKAIPCKTKIFGPAFIAEKLHSPYRRKDKETLLIRQKLTRVLAENPALKVKFDRLLDDARRYEIDIVILMSDEFKNERCSELAQLSLLKKEESFQYPLRKYFSVDPVGRTLWTPLAVFMALAQVRTGYACLGSVPEAFDDALKAKSFLDHFDKSATLGAQTFFGTTAAVTSLFSFYGIYRDYVNAVEKRSKMHALNRLIQIAQELEHLCEEYEIDTEFKMRDIQDPRALELLDELGHSRYQEVESTIFAMPLVHTLAYRLYKHDEQLAMIFASIGEMDAYNAFATKIIESYDKKNKFCLVEILEDERPLIDAHGFWSMLFKHAVANNLTESENILLTGPNAGGKSTTIRGIMQNILLGQCFGVAAAEEFKFTMFDVIHSYININDNPSKGESKFMVELKRAISIYDKIESLEPDQKYFFALDELFTSTLVEPGEKCGEAFMRFVATPHNVQCIYATHFEKLKEMGKAKDSGIVNYKVDDPIEKRDGSLVYPFTVSQGTSNLNVAIKMATEAGLFRTFKAKHAQVQAQETMIPAAA